MQFTNRIEAGRLLAKKFDKFANRSDLIVLALPRGGVPVAYEVAHALRAPLDVLIEKDKVRLGERTMDKESITMKTKEIPRNEWQAFFDSFSRQHEGWLVDLEIFGLEIGAQVVERQLALEGITDEWDETEGNTIIIMTGAKPDNHITHSITRPTQVSLEQTDEGADAALAIKAGEGTTALLRFRSAIRSEMVDAMV